MCSNFENGIKGGRLGLASFSLDIRRRKITAAQPAMLQCRVLPLGARPRWRLAPAAPGAAPPRAPRPPSAARQSGLLARRGPRLAQASPDHNANEETLMNCCTLRICIPWIYFWSKQEVHLTIWRSSGSGIKNYLFPSCARLLCALCAYDKVFALLALCRYQASARMGLQENTLLLCSSSSVALAFSTREVNRARSYILLYRMSATALAAGRAALLNERTSFARCSSSSSQALSAASSLFSCPQSMTTARNGWMRQRKIYELGVVCAVCSTTSEYDSTAFADALKPQTIRYPRRCDHETPTMHPR